MIRFGPFQIDSRTWSLSRGGDPVDLSPRLVEILAAIAEKNGEIVTKDELLDRFWPGVNISENTLTRAVADIRKALGEQASEPHYIKTLARRGFRFIADASVERPAPDEDPFQAWVQGKLALDMLNPEVWRARESARGIERPAIGHFVEARTKATAILLQPAGL